MALVLPEYGKQAMDASLVGMVIRKGHMGED